MEKRKTLEKKIPNKEKKKLLQDYGDEHNLEVKLKERERLLTEQERRCIVDGLENRDWKLMIGVCILILLLIVALSWGIYRPDKIIDSIICFIWWFLAVVLGLGDTLISANKLLTTAKRNEVYVKEAVFLGSNKYHHGGFEIMKNGKRKYFGCRATLRDDIKRGDKVILVKMKKKYMWVYKAREDEMLTKL